jgi:TRAP-type mannitol/chloroaromatic compound transport system substrate-binding protein
MSIQKDKPQASRRKFLRGAATAAAGTAALGFPMIVKAQGPISMRWQSTWPAKDIFHEYANDFAKKVNDMTGGDLRIEVLPAGAVVPAFGMFEAVSKGTLDGGHGVLVYHYGRQNALALWGSGPAFGMDANMLLSWHKYGGGKDLLNKLIASVGGNIVSFPYGPMPTQPLGWFKKPITKAEDFKGLKFRTVGISIDVFTALGAAVNALPGGEIVPAMDRGLLDAAEFNNATSDRLLGFADVSKVCMLQSYHQNAEQFEISFNKTKYDALPTKILQDARRRAAAPAHRLRRRRRQERRGQRAVQGDRGFAEGVRRAHGTLGPRHQRRPAHGVQPLLRQARRQAGSEESLTQD